MENFPKTVEPSHLLDDGHYAGFFQRGLAAVIDGLIVGTLGRWIGSLIFGPKDIKLVLVSTLVWWAYFAFMESSVKQGTIGKMFLKIKVTDLSGNRVSLSRASVRHFSKYISGLALGIGFLMAIWTDRKQGLHDIIAKTLVVRK